MLTQALGNSVTRPNPDAGTLTPLVKEDVALELTSKTTKRLRETRGCLKKEGHPNIQGAEIIFAVKK